ncbi:MAG: type I glyceraldehyde-3-phosphate dehydrogenase [Acidimicrobiales bacterium]
MTIRVGINGFGRMGRALTRIVAEQPTALLEVVAVNDLGTPEQLARLLARDSVYGRFPEAVTVGGSDLMVGKKRIRLLTEPQVKALPWNELGVDVVVEATGRFTSRDQASAHLDAGAPRVVVSAPSKGADGTFVMGVNDDEFDPDRHFIVSNASCTTNCLAVLAKVLVDAFGIEDGLMTTVHAYTGDQCLVDSLHKDPRRARAAAVNIVPTTTGAARATGQVVASLAGHLDGLAMRVPVPDASVTDLVALLPAAQTVEEIDRAYQVAASGSPLAGRLEYSNDDLVSSDVVGSPASCVYDAGLTMVQGRLAKVMGWYDNEWGYASRLAELVALVGAAGCP